MHTSSCPPEQRRPERVPCSVGGCASLPGSGGPCLAEAESASAVTGCFNRFVRTYTSRCPDRARAASTKSRRIGAVSGYTTALYLGSPWPAGACTELVSQPAALCTSKWLLHTKRRLL